MKCAASEFKLKQLLYPLCHRDCLKLTKHQHLYKVFII